MSDFFSAAEKADSVHSVTGWFHALQAGDEVAATRLWDRYHKRIAGLARAHLVKDAAYDEEDAAISVFDALFRAAHDGRHNDVSSRDELWNLLIVITKRKIIDRARHAQARRRTPDRPSGRMTTAADLEHEVATGAAGPDWEVALADQCRRLLELLNDSRSEQVALLKLDQYSNQEIAQRMQVSERTVKRTTALIRRIWQQELEREAE